MHAGPMRNEGAKEGVSEKAGRKNEKKRHLADDAALLLLHVGPDKAAHDHRSTEAEIEQLTESATVFRVFGYLRSARALPYAFRIAPCSDSNYLVPCCVWWGFPLIPSAIFRKRNAEQRAEAEAKAKAPS